MAEKHAQDTRTDLIKSRLQDELVDDEGNAVDPDAVASEVDAAAEPFVDAPVQEFTPLLIEHGARDALHDKGFHRDFGDDPENAPLAHEENDDES